MTAQVAAMAFGKISWRVPLLMLVELALRLAPEELVWPLLSTKIPARPLSAMKLAPPVRNEPPTVLLNEPAPRLTPLPVLPKGVAASVCVPMRLPCTKLLLVRAPEIETPSPVLPEMTLVTPAVVPPMKLPEIALAKPETVLPIMLLLAPLWIKTPV